VADMVSCRHPVINHHTENAETFDALNSAARWWRLPLHRPSPQPPRTEHEFFTLRTVQREVVRSSPFVDVHLLRLASSHVSSLAAGVTGTTRCVIGNSAYFRILLPSCSGCRSADVTMNDAGPRPEQSPAQRWPVYLRVVRCLQHISYNV